MTVVRRNTCSGNLRNSLNVLVVRESLMRRRREMALDTNKFVFNALYIFSLKCWRVVEA